MSHWKAYEFGIRMFEQGMSLDAAMNQAEPTRRSDVRDGWTSAKQGNI